MTQNNKVVLIRPMNVYNYNNYPPLGLISMGSALKAKGYDVVIINSPFEQDTLKAVSEALPGALFAAVSIMTSEIPDAYRIMKHIKATSNVPLLVGGWHCTLFPEQTAELPEVDYLIPGEGEEHVVALADALKAGKTLPKIFTRKMLDMESLPAPDYSLDHIIERFITSYLTDKLSQVVRQPMRWLPYESSRGCPSQCTFCINVVADNMRYRKKSAKKVVDEIEMLVRNHQLTHLKIVDDNFFVDIKRTRAICEGMIERNLNITWDGECRCDYFNERHMNDETLALLKKSGLIQLTLGIESGSPHTLKLMKKGIKPEQAKHAVRQCDRYGIIARSSFIIEIPGESMADIKQTISFVNEMRKYKQFTCGVGTFRPYPKCELTDGLIKQGVLKEPETFLDWTSRSVIDLYTAAEYARPWQVDPQFSESAAYYLNMESAIRLGNHLIDRKIDRVINTIFMTIGKIRNRLMFYHFPVEKEMYKRFFTRIYERKKDADRNSSNDVPSETVKKDTMREVVNAEC